MDYKKTLFAFLSKDCLDEFGQDAGTKIYARACERFSALLKEADYRNRKGIKEHIVKNMFPMIAYYSALQDQGFSKEEAYDLTLKETQKAAHIQRRKNRMLAKTPFAYPLFKLFSKGVIKRQYPMEGWDIEWVRFDGQEIHMNFKSCLCAELTSQLGCPELCAVFCENDPVTFSGYQPKIFFARNGTIAEGADYCDFHFVRGK